MLPAFIEQHPTDFSKYDPDACWPSLLDDYVESLKKAEKKEKKIKTNNIINKPKF